MVYMCYVYTEINFYVYGQADLEEDIHRNQTLLRKDIIYCKFEQHEKKLSGKEKFRISCFFLLNNF